MTDGYTIPRRSREQRDLAEALLDKNIDRMKAADLDLAMALLIGKVARLNGGIEVLSGEGWAPFSPMTNGDHFIEVLTGSELVFHSSPIWGDMNDDGSSPIIGRRYCCHSGFGKTETEGKEFRAVVGRTCAKRLAHDLEFSSQWRLDNPGSVPKP